MTTPSRQPNEIAWSAADRTCLRGDTLANPVNARTRKFRGTRVHRGLKRLLLAILLLGVFSRAQAYDDETPNLVANAFAAPGRVPVRNALILSFTGVDISCKPWGYIREGTDYMLYGLDTKLVPRTPATNDGFGATLYEVSQQIFNFSALGIDNSITTPGGTQFLLPGRVRITAPVLTGVQQDFDSHTLFIYYEFSIQADVYDFQTASLYPAGFAVTNNFINLGPHGMRMTVIYTHCKEIEAVTDGGYPIAGGALVPNDENGSSTQFFCRISPSGVNFPLDSWELYDLSPEPLFVKQINDAFGAPPELIDDLAYSRAFPASGQGFLGDSGLKGGAGTGFVGLTDALPLNKVDDLPGSFSRQVSANFLDMNFWALTSLLTAHPTFFIAETPLANGVYFLKFPNGNPFGYYSYLTDPHYIYHFDLGYEYIFDAADGKNGVYLYDFKSGGFFYTSPSFPFPYMYDFSLNSVVYYYPNPGDPQHYNTNGIRYFYVVNTGQIISK